MLRCAGTATSTFGGGGGTKLFCSQALKTPNANTAKAIRPTAADFCLTLVHDAERIGFISVAPFILRPRRFSFQKNAFCDAMNSNNPLAVEPESENDAALKFFSASTFEI
jgi:hypothetical protein